ncbi:MAG: LytR C-terminal domain-containing protein [Bacteroidota bacterium]
MAEAPSRSGIRLISLVVIGVLVLVLGYALVAQLLRPPADPYREDNPTGLVGDIIQVEVRNGCGISGIADVTRGFLRAGGFDVVEVGNYERFDVGTSYVVDRVGDLEAARKVANALGISEAQVRQEIRADYFLDASIVLGADYETLLPFRDTAAPSP